MHHTTAVSAGNIAALQVPDLIDLRDPVDERVAGSRAPTLPAAGHYRTPWIALDRLQMPQRCAACGSGAAYGSMRVDGDDPSARTKLALTMAMCFRCEWVLRDSGVAPGTTPGSGWLGSLSVPSHLKPAYKQIVGSVRFRVKRSRNATRLRFTFTNAVMADAFASLNSG